jgi:ribonuclease VapC
MTRVLDASVLLALLFDEPGAEKAADVIAMGATVSAVNLGEVATVLSRNDWDAEKTLAPLRAQVKVEPFTDRDALAVAALNPKVSRKGLSIGDRACLALAQRLGVAAVTADQVWAQLHLDVSVELIR